MPFSPKQHEYLMNATHRWNFKTGATRSGKTLLDYAVVIPKRIMACRGDGLIFLIGNNKNSIERNVLSPMRNLWPDLVGTIQQQTGVVEIFGKKCYAMGADKVNQVARLQGAGIEYCYGDEVATWHPEVFEMLKSRLDTPNACFDGTCNPEHPLHWLKVFLDSDADIYHQHYQIDDNPFLDPVFVENLKREYKGTVYYDRYILGRWVQAEGIIYHQFASNKEAYLVPPGKEYLKDVEFASIGIDFGGNRSLTTFVATAAHANLHKLTVIADHHIEGKKGEIDADRLCREFIGFVQRFRTMYPWIQIRYCWADNEAQYLINSLRKAVRENGFGFRVDDAKKKRILDRIVATSTLLNTKRLFITHNCELVQGGLENALWDSKHPDQRLDNFSTDIDILDAFEYSWEPFISRLCPDMKAR